MRDRTDSSTDGPTIDGLTAEEVRLWRAFRKATDRLGDALTRRVTAAAGLSAPEFGVLGLLAALADANDGTAPQAELLARSGWDKSRLSHLLRRMEARGLVERRAERRAADATGGAKRVLVAATADGRARHARAAPAHARALRELLFDPLGPAGQGALADVLARLAPELAAPPGSPPNASA